MPAFSHFFLKRLSARSKFSSSWIMTSDKFYFPPSWRLCAGVGQIVKLRRGKGMGQANLSLSLCFGGDSLSLRPVVHRRYVGGVLFGSRLSLVAPPTFNMQLSRFAWQGHTDLSVARGLSPTRTPSDFPLRPSRKRGRTWRLARTRVDLLDALCPRPRIAGRATLGCPAAKGGSARARTGGADAPWRFAPPGQRGARAVTSLCREARVSSEGAAAASAAARRSGAASRKATLQARAPEEDTLADPRAEMPLAQRCH